MLTLGIETSCDETSVALLRGDDSIEANLIASQIEAHRLFGGVVPEIASRQHLEVLNKLLAQLAEQTGVAWRDIDLVAVTHGPGLVGALLVGVAAAKALSYAYRIPCIAVNHVEGHVLSNFLTPDKPRLPMLALVVSGGHTDLVLMRAHGRFERVGRTRDDAVGEAYDKVARALDLPQPGGPMLEAAAREGNVSAFTSNVKGFTFTAANLEPSLDFSFSGLKTAAAQAMTKHRGRPGVANDIAAAFEASALRQLRRTVERAILEFSPATLGLCGGVAANRALRAQMEGAARAAGIGFVVPESILCTDNAAMIAAAGLARYRLKPAEQRHYDLAGLGFETHSVLPIA